MWQVLIARSLSDMVSSALCGIVVSLTGLAVGWRPHSDVASVLAGFGIALLFSYSLSWFSACVGIMSLGPESAQGVGLVLFFPLALVSNAIVPTGGMPSWLQAFANWSPVSTTTAALRDLFGNAKTSAVGDWPTRHPVGATVVWALILLSVCTPLAAVMYRKRTTR